jgi:CspA family cold shock protein
MLQDMTVEGTAREWHDDLGWGVVDSAATPGGCWAHFSSVAVSGYRSLRPGQAVSLEYESFDQDGFQFRALRVWPSGMTPYEALLQDGSSPAYHSKLDLTFDE